MKRFLIAFFASVPLLLSCTGNKVQQTDPELADSLTDTVDSLPIDTLEQLLVETPTPKAMDELFDDFFFNFAANKKLQKSRVIFPLSVHKDGKTEQIEKEQWKMDHFFIRQGYYTLLFDDEQQMELMKDTSITKAIVEKILLKKNTVREYIFNRIRGAWMLREINETGLEANGNASFLLFYQRFASDLEFQVSSLNATVSFVGPDPDDDFNTMEGIITPDTWEAFAPQLPSKLIYNVVYGDRRPEGRQMIFIMRGIANGQEMELRFRKENDRWLLMKMTT